MIAIVQWQGLTCMLTPNVQMYSEYRGFLSQVGSSTSLMRPQVREMKRMGKERYSATYMEKRQTDRLYTFDNNLILYHQ